MRSCSSPSIHPVYLAKHHASYFFPQVPGTTGGSSFVLPTPSSYLNAPYPAVRPTGAGSKACLMASQGALLGMASLHFPSLLHAFIPESPIEAQKAGVGNMTHATTINLCYYTLLVDVTKQSPVCPVSLPGKHRRAARCRHSPLRRESPGSSRAAGPPPSPDRHPVLAGGGLVAHLKGQNPGLPPHRGQRGVPAARACPL